MQANPDHGPYGHRTVLALPAVERLIGDASGTYVDATYGRGGHALLILERLAPGGRLIALDRDVQSLDAAKALADPRFHFVHTQFSRMTVTLHALGIERVHGVLADLGVSSPQIDDPQRGFSWRFEAPLDMRMDTTQGMTAAQWLASTTSDSIARVLRDYGEERFAASIAKAIVARCEAGRPVSTTTELAALVADTVPRSRRKDAAQHPATRTFQALRIHINQELEELPLMLAQALSVLCPGGRLAVISFHSLEDRIVKRFIDMHAHPERPLAHLPLRQDQMPQPRLRAVARVLPDRAEIAANPRARSAVLRVAERTEQSLAESR